jgi:hypothetical protein
LPMKPREQLLGEGGLTRKASALEVLNAEPEKVF